MLKTNDVAVSLKISTCTHISLNRVKGAPSGLMGDIVQYTSDLQVFELKHKSLPGDLKLKIKVWRLSLKMVCWLLILFTIVDQFAGSLGVIVTVTAPVCF